MSKRKKFLSALIDFLDEWDVVLYTTGWAIVAALRDKEEDLCIGDTVDSEGVKSILRIENRRGRNE